jgi:hypothetical protein
VDSPRKHSRLCEQAAALIIVLALVVLATGLVVAYFSRATSDRPVAHSSYNQSKVDQLAQSAMDNIIGDLRYEIVHGSVSPAPTFGPASLPGPFNLYVPTTCLACTPAPSPGSTTCPNSTPTILPISPIRYPTPIPGTTPRLANFIRRSLASDAIPCPAKASRASAVNSTTDVSANGRSVTLARWNNHYLLPKYNAGSDDPTPPSPLGSPFNPNPPVPDGFTPPDWVYATAEYGSDVLLSPTTDLDGRPITPIGRYAYAIYDEGGLVDMNAAGYPSPTTILQYGRKGSLAFADLTGLPGLSPNPNSTPVDSIVGWRNYASAQPSGLFPNFSFNTNATNTYYNFVLSDPNYIQLTNYFTNSPLIYSPIFFLTTAWQAPQNNNQTDQRFITRQSLLKLRSAVSGGGIGFVNALQYLGTRFREAMASVPQWSPVTPDSINPNFQTLLVTAPFTRNDGTTAYVGDYLVNNRFLLQRLNWLTYKGPSATRTIPTSAPSLGDANYDMWLLMRPNGITFGLTSAFLQQGTAANILNYFGLAWDATNERWNYVGHNGSSTPIDSISTFGIGGTQAATREPDFFELLQAGIINNNDLGDSFSPDPALPSVHQASKMLHILTIGANLIAQSRADSYPVRIACTVNVNGTPTVMEAVGIPRLPCINSLAACAVGATQAAGGIHWFLVPNLWDPFRDSWDLTEVNAGNTGNGPNLTPGYLRPPVRIRIQGSVAFGSIPRSSSVVSGSAQSGVTTFSLGSINGIDSNLTFVTGATTNNWYGRDGFLEAMRLRASDVSNTVTQFTPTNSPITFNEWNSLPITNMTQVGPGGNQRWIVYRVSLAGSNIPVSAFTPAQNPALILKPGFQVTMEYQSPNGNWYPYSFLQGNNASSTWIGNTSPTSNLNLVTDYSIYGKLSLTIPTLLNSSDLATATPWATATLAHAPMFAKADPRSIRYNSQIGVLNITSPPMASASAGIVGSLWPDAYTTTLPTPTPPAFWTMTSPGPTPSPNPNPALYSASDENAAVARNPYDEVYGAGRDSNPYRPVMMNRPFRSVGEMGYAFRDQPFRTLSFSSTNSPDAGLLALFTTTAYGPTPTPSPSPSITPSYPTPTATPRGGIISLNSLQAPALASVLASTITREDIPRQFTGGAPSPTPTTVTATQANNVATSFVLSTGSTPLVNRAGLANLIASETGLGPTVPKTQRESIARALGEVDQTRTWNLMIDVIAQSGRYPPNVTSLQNGFVVEGEQRYWVHVAIDRFTGQVIDKQIEVVNE